MSERYTGIITHLVSLLEGKVSGLDRPVPADKFKLIDFEPERALAEANEEPYPFEIDELGTFEPFEAVYNLAGSHQYQGSRVQIRIAYSATPHNQHARFQTVREDRRAVARCLTFPDSWDAAAGFVKCEWESGEIVPVSIPGSEAAMDEGDVMLILAIELALTYREDMTS